MNGLESYRRKDGQGWSIRPLSMHGGPLTDGNGDVLIFSTKVLAESFRRNLERRMTDIPRERDEFFGRVDRSGRRR